MIRFKTLLKLNIKRAFIALPQLIFGAIALIFLVSAIAFCGNKYLYGAIGNSSDGQTFSIAIVMNDTSDLAGKVTDGVLGMSEVTSTIDFHFVDEDGAMEGLSSGQFIAALVVPENTAHNIVHGSNTPMTVIFPEDSGFEAVLIKEITDAVATMLSSAQAGIYSLYDFYVDNGAKTFTDDALLRMNLKYINLVATSNSMFDTTTVSATGSIPLMTYYISGALILFALLFGINCFRFLDAHNPQTSKRLSINGTPLILQGLSPYISTMASQITAIAIVIAPAIWIISLFDLKLSLQGIMGLLFTLPIFVMLSSSIIYFISRITPHNMGRIMITFFATIVMCFVSGCFIPSIMLPEILQTVSRFLPTHYMITFCSHIMVGDFDGMSLLMCLIFTVTIYLAGVAMSWFKRRKELI